MHQVRTILVALSLVAGLGASATAATAKRPARFVATGIYGDYLDARAAASDADADTAAEASLRALSLDPTSAELQRQAFLACLIDGRPEALPLARQLPDNPSAQLLLANRDVKSGNWEAAEQRFRALPRQGATQVLQPMLVAWAQQGAGHTDAALATLRPFADGQRFRGVYALHAALIADVAGRTAEAGRLYAVARAEYGGMNVRLGQILASWQARQGHSAEALQTLKALADNAHEIAIALPNLANAIAARTGVAIQVEPALLERDFGAWELRTWDEIYIEVGDSMHGLIHHPATYRPPEGETTDELRDRAMAWYDRRPLGGLVVAVAHGGPIAAIRGTLAGKGPVDWVDLIPEPGTWVTLPEGSG